VRRRALKKRYGRALPLVLIPLVKAGGVAFAKLKSLGLVERAIEPVAELGHKAWVAVAGTPEKKHRRTS
jgi:hypothetical protein